MENSLPSDLENSLLKAQFQRDLIALRGIYSEEVLTLVENNIDILLKDYISWQKALTIMARNFGIESSNSNEIPSMIEQVTFEKVKEVLSATKAGKIILGVAGPGAVGKETIKDALGFNTVVNTTTRPKRDYEKEDQHYHFIDEARFKDITAQDGFVISMDRQGRGQYGIQKQDIEKVLQTSPIAIIEENPANLMSLSEYIKTRKDYKFILVYILPPSPILPHLAARLAGRCQKTGEDFRPAVVSTLGTRQLDEFKSTLDFIKKGNNIIFAINDNVDRVVGKIKNLVETK